MGGYAWVTLATNDSYSLGALVLAHSLRNSNTTAKLAVLITPAVSQPMRDQLQATFDLVKLVDVLDSKDEAHLALLKRPELGVTFTKIHCWTLTEFEKCVFLDADTMVVRNCDELFERDEFSAAPDVSWPDCFNSGVFVYKPSVETFNKILQYAVDFGSFDGGDQGLLNQFFSDWATKDIKKHLPFVYNLTTVAVYSYIPAFKKYGSETRIVHFIGTGKPWLHQLDPATKTITPISGSEHLTPLLQKWWDIFCEKVHPSLNKELDRDNEFVDACTDSVAVEFSDECESACLLEPDTPYREENDYRQINLPYQPFDVVSSSGELLNVGFSFAFDENSRKDDESDGNIRETAVQKVDTLERREDDRVEERRILFESTECEKTEEVVDECFVQEICCENKEDDKNEPELKEIKAAGVETEKAPIHFDNFFPDDVCVNNYLEQNVKQYQPFNCCHNAVTETCQTLNNFKKTENTQNNQEPIIPQLPRFLTMPENDKRQSGNIPFISKPKDPLSPLPPPPSPPPSSPLPPQCVPFRSGSNSEPQRSNENDPQELLNETVCTSSENSHIANHEQTNIKITTNTKPLSKSKSTSNLIFDAMSVDQYLPIDSTWSRQTNSKLELNRRFSLPKLKPLLPKHSAVYKSTPSVVPKVTLYTELLMSSEYKDPLNLPIDKEGFVENQIVKQSNLRRTKSDDHLRAKFGPLPYTADFKYLMSPKFQKSSVSLSEFGVYDLKDCKRQLGNKPKAVENDSTTNVPKSQCKVSRKRKRKEQHIYEKRENFGDEKRIKKDRKNEKQQTKEKKAAPIFSSFSNDYSKRTNNVSEILKRLIDFSKDYLHFFGNLNGENPKALCQPCTKYQSSVERKNAMIQTGSASPGEPENLYEIHSASTPTIRKYENNSARGDLFRMTPSKGFERFRNYVYDQSQTTQKGLMGMQDVLKEGDIASSSDKSLSTTMERHRNDESSYEKYSRIGDTKSMTYQMILFRDFQRWKRRFEEEYGIVPLLRGGNIWSRTTIPLPWLKHTLNWNGSPGTAFSQKLNSQRDFFINKTSSDFRHLNGGSCDPKIPGTNNKKGRLVGETSKSLIKTPFNSPSTSTVTMSTHSKNCIKPERYSIEHRLPPYDSPEGILPQPSTTSRRHDEQSYELTVNGKNELFNGIRTATTFKSTDTSNLLATDSNSDRSRGNGAAETGNNPGIAGAIAQLDLENGTKKDNPSPGRESSAHEEYLRRQNWETGNMDYMGRDSFDNIWSKICKTLEDKASGEKTQGLKDGKKLLESKGESKEPNSQAAPVDLAATSVSNSGLIPSPVTSHPPIVPSAVLSEAVGATPVSTTTAVSPKVFEPPKTDLLKSVAENACTSITTPETPDVSSLSSQLSALKAEKTTLVSPVETNISALPPMPVQTPPSSQVTDSKEIPLGKSDAPVCAPQSPAAPQSTEKILQGTTPSNSSSTSSGSLPPIVTAAPSATNVVPQPASEKSPTTMQPLSSAQVEGTKTPTTKDTQVQPTNQAQVSITETPPTPLEKDAKECELAPCPKEEKKEEKCQEPKVEKQPDEKSSSKPDQKSSGDDKNTAVVPYCDVFQSAKNAQTAEARTDKENLRKSVQEAIKKQGEAKSDQFPPIPLPESPTEVKPPMELSSVQKNSKENSPKEEKKGMISKILDFVGVSPKGKDGEPEGSKSTFYDVSAAETPAQPKPKENETSEVQPADKPVPKPDDKVQEPTNASVQDVKANSEKEKNQEKPMQPVPTEEKKTEKEAADDNQKEMDKKSSKKNKGKSPKPPPAGDKKKDSKHPEPEKKPDLPSKESAQGNRGNQKDKSKPKQDNKQANAGGKKAEAPKAPEPQQTKPTDEPKTGENAVKNKKKSPSPNLSISEPVSPAESEQPKPAFLTIDNTIPDTPPAGGMKPAASEPETMETVEGKIKKEVDAIIDKAKTVVENQLENRKSAEEQVSGGSAQPSDKNEEVNALKMIADEGKGAVKPESKPSQQQQHHHQGKQKNQQDQKGKRGSQKHGSSHSQVRPEEIEEIKVTSEEERKRHKTEPATSKLSEQILKAIPPPRRKAISESKPDTPPTTPPPDTDTRPEPEAKPEPKPETQPEAQQSEIPKSEPKKPEVPKPGEPTKANAAAKGKSVSEPVPPPRNKSKPRQKTPPKGKPKK